MILAAAAGTAAHATTTTAPGTHGFLSPTGVEIAFLLVGLVTFGAAVITVDAEFVTGSRSYFREKSRTFCLS